MTTVRDSLRLLFISAALALSGCSLFQRSEPVLVHLVGVDALPGEGLELRMLVKLRVQNPTDKALEYNGVFVEMAVQGKRFATGVSDDTGSIPRYSEVIVGVPVSISAFGIARQTMGLLSNEFHGKLVYELRGNISGPSFHGVSFKSGGEFVLPTDIAPEY